jgi:hypothetical protein
MKWVNALLCIWSISLIAGCVYSLDLVDDDDDDDDDDWEEAVLIGSEWEGWSADRTVAIVQPFFGPSLASLAISLTADDGHPIEFELRTSTNSWTADASCVTRNATGQVLAADRTLEVEVTGYQRCGLACPSAGVVTLSDGSRSVRLSFDGGDHARLERSDGAVERAQLACLGATVAEQAGR